MRQANTASVNIRKSQSQGFSLSDQKWTPFERKNLTGPLSQGLEIFRIRRSYSYKNLPQTTENQKFMLWITVGF